MKDKFSIDTGLKPIYERAYRGETVHTDEFTIEMGRAAEDWGTQSGQIWFRMSLIPLFALDGSVESVLVIMCETTAARKAAKTLQLASRRDGIELIAAGIAHDYNNLLTAIITNNELIQEISTEDEVRSLSADIYSASEQATLLNRKLLSYAGMNLRMVETLDLAVLTRDVVQIFQQTLLQFGELQLEMSGDDMLAEVDAGQYKQVVMNFLTNAMEALPKNAGSVRVTLRQVVLDDTTLEAFQFSGPAGPGRWNLLEVQDNGCGMPSDVRRHIFEPYFTTKSTGHGLGLASALGIIWNHGGGVSVQSTPEVGTSFQVVLPLSQHEQAAQKPAELPVSLPASAHVLLVDNSPYLRGSLRALLEHMNITVAEEEDGAQAWKHLECAQPLPDLVLMDIMIPSMNGLDVLRELRGTYETLPVLLMSTHGEMGQRGVCDDPFAAFIPKPFSPSELLQQVARMLQLVS
ncbi:MAG: response regulator [Myxococcota bacterium]|nr:response regulator [Myxococcota bacterium]